MAPSLQARRKSRRVHQRRIKTQHRNMAVDILYNVPLVWEEANSKLPHAEDTNRQLWCKHVGRALDMLLYNAGYSPDSHSQSLEFFARVVAPSMGVFPVTVDGSAKSSWDSFMTDDGCPIELSWDWGTSDREPTIRYSIEPIGPHAGTYLDPNNSLAGSVFQNNLNQVLPQMNLEWFYYFRDFFDDRRGIEFDEDKKGHKSSIFYAFDLADNSEITAKVYFFPKYRARARGQSNLQVIEQGILDAPGSTPESLQALSTFSEFCNEPSNKNLEHEMLAIDLIDTSESRFKIYFRCRETSFDSVVNVMTLGGRVKHPKIGEGLEKLHELWKALFGASLPPSQPLKENSHRTAGILYNVEFRLGDSFPVAKVYLPVRHYSISDNAVIGALDNYFQAHQRGSYMGAYSNVMNSLFNPESLSAQAGVQTYVGCAIRPNGDLRVVSYFKPPLAEPHSSAERY
ncbi:tryptophan dimethylallyltransferase-domain-containing protein [Xylaria sp. CBS 124048]|nr:tryptophan dimethylallyltransferase-domain-containing protein [Xylaria sp. CBS 124048]